MFWPFLLACSTLDRDPLQHAIDRIYRQDDGIPGIVLVVQSPTRHVAATAGFLARDGERKRRLEDPFRSASITKTLVSTALLMQQEDGRLSLDDPLSVRLSHESLQALRGDGYDPDRITLRHLLAHTAGVYDYTETPSFNEAPPQHRWSRAEQIQLAMAEGNPLHQPGTAYHYGDTHYILAGEALERATGKDLATSLRPVFQRAGMTQSWMESLEASPPGVDADRLSHPYIGEEDTRFWDPSWDLWGGGGMVSTAGDLVAFMQALFGGDLFEDPDSLRQMMTVDPVAEGAFYGLDGALGINRFRVEGVECWGGWGFFGTEMIHCPDKALTWAATLDQSEADNPDAITDAVLSHMTEGKTPWEISLPSVLSPRHCTMGGIPPRSFPFP